MPKSNSLLQAWLIHIILHASHLLCFFAPSWGEEGLASSVVLCTCWGRQREEIILGRSSHLGIGFWRCTVSGFSFKLCPVPQHDSCIYRHFGAELLVSPKWSCLFFLVFGQLISMIWTPSRSKLNRMALNSQRATFLYLTKASIKGMCCHTWLRKYI